MLLRETIRLAHSLIYSFSHLLLSPQTHVKIVRQTTKMKNATRTFKSQSDNRIIEEECYKNILNPEGMTGL